MDLIGNPITDFMLPFRALWHFLLGVFPLSISSDGVPSFDIGMLLVVLFFALLLLVLRHRFVQWFFPPLYGLVTYWWTLHATASTGSPAYGQALGNALLMVLVVKLVDWLKVPAAFAFIGGFIAIVLEQLVVRLVLERVLGQPSNAASGVLLALACIALLTGVIVGAAIANREAIRKTVDRLFNILYTVLGVVGMFSLFRFLTHVPATIGNDTLGYAPFGLFACATAILCFVPIGGYYLFLLGKDESNASRAKKWGLRRRLLGIPGISILAEIRTSWLNSFVWKTAQTKVFPTGIVVFVSLWIGTSVFFGSGSINLPLPDAITHVLESTDDFFPVTTDFSQMNDFSAVVPNSQSPIYACPSEQCEVLRTVRRPQAIVPVGVVSVKGQRWLEVPMGLQIGYYMRR